ncbi:CPBP family intramembrane glutamic endopeptidase [Oceanobacillus rekensis]|uniref:CPBP family intramembrane glutamic endopeptidase n=1 Tax=Oceanobacillus rekensis TaxID=937927 RepID=UPI000B44A9D0|nr:CPBP family intramembrane glutamic endopeptidase [Oceanobacillus rekensis]
MLKQAWIVSFIRFPMLVVSLFMMFLIFSFSGLEFQFPFLPEMSTLYFTVVNILCFFLLHRIVKNEGRSIKELTGYKRERLRKDILFGFLWLFTLFIPFVLTVMGVMFVIYGADMFQQFEAVFAGEGAVLYERPWWLMYFASIISLLFPIFNAPIEELMYRGYAQPIFMKHYNKMWIGILIPSIGFALQHTMLAATFEGAFIYAAAFFVWGIGSGINFHKQQRLFPLIICHFLVNISFSIFPIPFLVMGIY